MPGLEEPQVRIETVAFGPRGIELTYVELRDETPHVTTIKTKVIDPAIVELQVADALEALYDLLEAAELAARNPPDRIRPGLPRG